MLMDDKRFRQIRDWLGYNDSHLATALAIKESVVADYCQGKKQIPDEVAGQLEFYTDWWINVAG
jgi:predicted transcriptional regulator